MLARELRLPEPLLATGMLAAAARDVLAASRKPLKTKGPRRNVRPGGADRHHESGQPASDHQRSISRRIRFSLTGCDVPSPWAK